VGDSRPAGRTIGRRWKAAGGTVAFLAIGLLLTPGLTRRQEVEPGPASGSPALEGSAAVAQRTAPPAIQSPAASDADSAWAKAGAWLDDGPGSASSSASSAAGDAASGSESDRAFDCMIGPSQIVEVGSAITGVVDEVLVERSDYVVAGQVVARLEASVEEAAVRVARARAERTDSIESSRTNLVLSQARLGRARELHERDVLSLDALQEIEAQADLAALELERAEEDHRLARLQLDQARAALERRTIRTPVSGIVTERLLASGEVANEETLLRVARIDPLRVEAILPAEWFGRMKAGERAEIVPEAPLDQPRNAQVAIVDRVLDGASGTFTVDLDLPNGDHALPAGLRCQVHFSQPERESPVLARASRPPSSRGMRWEPAPAD